MNGLMVAPAKNGWGVYRKDTNELVESVPTLKQAQQLMEDTGTLARSKDGKKAESADTADAHKAAAKYHAVMSARQDSMSNASASEAHDKAADAHMDAASSPGGASSKKAQDASKNAHAADTMARGY